MSRKPPIPNETSLRFVLILLAASVLIYGRCELLAKDGLGLSLDYSGIYGIAGVLIGVAVAISSSRFLTHREYSRFASARFAALEAVTISEDAEKIRKALGIEHPVPILFRGDGSWHRTGLRTFGPPNKPFIIADRGIIALAATDEDKVRAMLTHEMAHVALKDFRYISVSQQFVRVALFCLWLLGSVEFAKLLYGLVFHSGQWASLSWGRFVVFIAYYSIIDTGLIALIFWNVIFRLALADLLRTREIRADELVRDAGLELKLNEILSNEPREPGSGSYFKKFFSSHPANSVRFSKYPASRGFRWSLFIYSTLCAAFVVLTQYVLIRVGLDSNKSHILSFIREMHITSGDDPAFQRLVTPTLPAFLMATSGCILAGILPVPFLILHKNHTEIGPNIFGESLSIILGAGLALGVSCLVNTDSYGHIANFWERVSLVTGTSLSLMMCVGISRLSAPRIIKKLTSTGFMRFSIYCYAFTNALLSAQIGMDVVYIFQTNPNGEVFRQLIGLFVRREKLLEGPLLLITIVIGSLIIPTFLFLISLSLIKRAQRETIT